MGWVHDSGYAPAYQHEGWPTGILDDGTDNGGTWTQEIGQHVTGWKAACSCGWRSNVFYPRAEWPSENGMAPQEVDGDDRACPRGDRRLGRPCIDAVRVGIDVDQDGDGVDV